MKKISELSFRKKCSLLFVLLVGTIYLIWLGSRLMSLVTYEKTMGKVSDIDHYRTIRAKGNLFTGSDETKVTVAYDVNGVRYETTITEGGTVRPILSAWRKRFIMIPKIRRGRLWRPGLAVWRRHRLYGGSLQLSCY